MSVPRASDGGHIATAADIEQRAGRILDPTTDLKTKILVATEIRDTVREIDSARDADTVRVLHFIIPSLLDLLSTGEVAYRKDSLEFQFRTLIITIISKIPYSEAAKAHFQTIYDCMLHVIRNDNEENAVLASKQLVELFRTNRQIPPNSLSHLTDLCRDIFMNMRPLADRFFQDNSPIRDANLALPSMQSFKVAAELGLVLAVYTQVLKDVIRTPVVVPAAVDFLAVEAPNQKVAREAYEATGKYWSGMSKTIRNPILYSELLAAQIKVLSYLTLVMRQQSDSTDVSGDVLVTQSLRILQDCPTHGISLRKDLMVVFRHLMTTQHRKVLLPQIDKLFDETVLLGTGLGSNEILRAPVFSAFTDLFHHIRSDLNTAQLERIVHLYSKQIHNPSLNIGLHIISAKVMFGTAEAIISRETGKATAVILEGMFKTCLDRLDALIITHERVSALVERTKSGETQPVMDDLFIEKARPIGGASFASEKLDDVMNDLRLLFKTLLHGFRVCLGGIRKCSDAKAPDGALIFRLFEGCIRCLASFDSDNRMDGDGAIDWFSPILLEVNLHVFQEVWTHKIGFFFDCAQKRVALLSICQFLFSREQQSPTLLAIVLQFLVDRLPMLGENEDLVVATTIRLYKIAFNAVSTHPGTNESILALHLGKLLMDCFPLAAKATKPTHYFHLLRALFRSIGGGGGRFELLYKEVLPLLPEMLECLNRQLNSSTGPTQDMIVELCLTVPLRLTHLLPHLSYLMQPLALALRGGPELVTQGLRTLELCIDNLTPDFLDPTLNLVLRELMEALHSHLKPLPGNHHIAHTTIRILGKLGGRNRRLLSREPLLKWKDQAPPPTTVISFAGKECKTELGSLVGPAVKTLKSGSSVDIAHSFEYLQQCLSVMLHDDIVGDSATKLFLSAMEGVFDAVHIAQTSEEAKTFIRGMGRTVFELEVQTARTREHEVRNAFTLLLTSFIDAIPHALTKDDEAEAGVACALVADIIGDLVAMIGQNGVTVLEITPILHQFSTRFIALCFGETWASKNAGCGGIKIMTNTPVVGHTWTIEREVEVLRALLHVLKDLPPDLPRNTDEIVQILVNVLGICCSSLDFTLENGAVARKKLVGFVGHFFPELQSSKSIVRDAVHTSLQLLVDCSGCPATELLMPHRDRMLVGIYTKPLRALPFSIQIGMIEAVRFCVSLDPPLVEVNDELLRLLHETLALADADDLHARGSARQSSMEITKLHVACIKLLTASMPLTDFFSKQHQTRQRVTGVYFKALYSPSQEIKDVAYDGLKMVLAHQSRLPRELLQTGLRPILMNLADAKRLSVPGLEGLARLLELLTNYFKVEIGHKLLDHFRVVADPQMLQESSKLPMLENEGIAKLVRLVNIFHLLPSTANIFLEHLINNVVNTEASMHFSDRSPFSEPLARYLNRYPQESIDFFLRQLTFPDHLRTLRSIIKAKLAPRVEAELSSRMPQLATQYLHANHPNLSPVLLLVHDLASSQQSWLQQHPYVVDSLLRVWHAPAAQHGVSAADFIDRQSVILSILKLALEQSSRIDLVFDVVAVYTRGLEMDLIRTAHFLYNHVALSDDIIYRRNVLMRFTTWFKDPTITWPHKAFVLRYVVTPTLLVQASKSKRDRLIGIDFMNAIQRMIWLGLADPSKFPETDDAFKIELLHFTTVMVQHYSDLIGDVKSAIWKFSLNYMHNEDPVVKQTVYLLNAHFYAAIPGSPAKFILKTWSDLLRSAQPEGSRGAIRQEALATLAPSLPSTEADGHSHYPQWAVTARRLLYEEGFSHTFTVYNLIIKEPDLFYPVRAMFVTHMVHSLSRLGLISSSTPETRNLSIDILHVIFNWESRAKKEQLERMDTGEPQKDLTTPLLYRENMVSYLVRLASPLPEGQSKVISTVAIPRALSLLKTIIGPTGWKDVAFGLGFFMRALERNELDNELNVTQAILAAKVLHVISAEQSDQWYMSNAEYLQKLVKKGLLTNENALHDALHPIFDRLIALFPLPKEDDEQQQGELSEFHSFVYSAINDALHSANAVRGPLLMLQSVVKVSPERVEAFSVHLLKLLTRLARDHVQPTKETPVVPGQALPDMNVRLILCILDICQASIAYLADQRKVLLTNLAILAENTKSRNPHIMRYMLNLARTWALKQESYPATKDKANLLNKMGAFEGKGGEVFNLYLELILDIFNEPSLRRSDLTSRLEPAFLLGCRASDTKIRERFLDLLDTNVPRSLFSRVTYICGVQNWETLADHNWIYLALYLLLGSADKTEPSNTRSLIASKGATIPRAKSQSIIRSFQRLSYLDPHAAHNAWVSIFPAAWSCLTRREQADVTYHTIVLLSKDYHNRQAHVRPNVIESLLTGIHSCSPPMTLPPHLVKYLAKTFGCWFVSLEILGASIETVKDDEPNIREFVYDSLADVYAELAEDDMFYGVWRKRSLYSETNIALAFEQNGMWEQAATVYESAQSKARTGAIPFSESEYCLWEDHWILSAEKLQHWEILGELGRADSNPEMMLESAWRLKDWTQDRAAIDEMVAQLPDVPTPRRRVFEAFLALLKTPAALDKNVEFTRILEDAMQLSLRKWVGLPTPLSAAHVPLLQHFQQFVELQEAVQIFGSLSQTTSQNLEKKSSELKMVLQAWRERLPNLHDDISIWSDLVAWRQRVFDAINNAYIPLISGTNQSGNGAASNANTFGYRGYHETAWIINRFAHVARKHDLLEACFTSLAKIYTLPNIEISEAFLKLREQARCYYQKPNDLQAGLEVINNTNLHYFSASQKAEFFTLKAMFLARASHTDANPTFGQAVQMDMNQAKVWAEWGRFHDRLFPDNHDYAHASQAVSCYLTAAGLYKNGKSRLLLARVLWFLSIDEGLNAVRAFDTYKGEGAFWYWITLIPQLCSSISLREVKQARYILLNLAKHFPQALFFHIRTTREEIHNIRRMAAARAAAAAAASGSANPIDPSRPMEGVTPTSSSMQEGTNGEPRTAWDHVEDIVQLLKTAFPLLILSLETMLDQMLQRFKPSPEEECYRHVSMLLQDASQHYLLRMNQPVEDVEMGPQLTATVTRFVQNMSGKMRVDFEADFIANKLNVYEYIVRLQQWRDRYEKILDARPKMQALDNLSHYLTEFQYSKVDEIEIPGQYTEDKDNNQNFVRIQKFAPRFENYRASGLASKRITMFGSDNSSVSFVVQQPANRFYRREEKVQQLFRTFNGTLSRKKETRKRNLSFHVPVAVSCSPSLRLFQMDDSYVSFSDMFDLHCESIGLSRETPMLYSGEKVNKMLREIRASGATGQPTKPEYLTMKKTIYDEVLAKMVPEDIITKYMMRTMEGPSELWRMRKQFATQIAGTSFMTFMMFLGARHPIRFFISRSTGHVVMTDPLPSFSQSTPHFAVNDVVPFRLTPNMQHFMTPLFIEGILTSSLIAMGRSLTEPSSELEHHLTLFCREEVLAWMRPKSVNPDAPNSQFRHHVTTNIDLIVKRAESLACKMERDQALQGFPPTVPVMQTVIHLISSASNPVQLAKMGEIYFPWF